MNSSPVDDLALGGIDTFLPVVKAHKDLLSRVDEVIERAVEEQDLGIVENAVLGLLSVSQISGIALAKFLYVTHFQWDKFKSRDTHMQWAMSTFDKEKVTIERYFRVWEMLVSGDIPREYAKRLEAMPIRCLIPIGTLWGKQKYEISTQQWSKLANASNPSEVNKIIREIKGVKPKEGSLQIEWNSSEKKITGWKGNKPHVIYLQYDENDDVIEAMLSRIFSDKVLEK